MERRLIDTAPGGGRHHAADDLLHQLARARRLPLPRLLEDRRAGSRHGPRLRHRARHPQAGRVGRHDARRRGDRARHRARGQPGVVLRPVGRPRVLGRQLRHHQPRPRPRRRAGLPHPASRGSTARYRAEVGSSPRDLGKVVRYVGLNLLFTSLAAVPAVLHGRPPAADASTSTSTRSRAGRESTPRARYIKRDLFLSEERELPDRRTARRRTTRTCRSRASFKRCYERVRLDRRAVLPALRRATRPYANLFLSRGAQPAAASSTATATTRPALLNYAIGDPALDPALLGFADDNWLDGTQSGVFSFVSPGHRRERATG